MLDLAPFQYEEQGVEVKIQVFLNSVLEGSEWLASAFDLFNPRNFPPGDQKQRNSRQGEQRAS